MKLFFQKLIDSKEFHPKYKRLNNEHMLQGERNILEGWSNGFIDRDGKLLHEFQTTFHSTFWEFYIHQLLKNMDEKIDFSKNRPDFIVKNADGSDKFYIEAVVSQIKRDGRPEIDRNHEDLELTERPVWKLDDFETIINEGAIRSSNAIKSKLDKYESYSKLSWVNPEVPYIVGMSSFSQVNYGLESHYSILALLYGYYIKEDGINFEKRYSVIKEDTKAEISLNIFDDQKYSDISAVLFSSKVTLGKLTALSISAGYPTYNMLLDVYQDSDYPFFKIKSVSPDSPELFADGLFLFHNPKAKVPLNPDFFKEQGIIQVFQEEGYLKFDGDQLPLICRVNRALMKPMEALYIQKLGIDFNSHDY